MGTEVVTLASIGNGAAMEVFQREIEKVIMNIADVNTPARAVRKITIEVIIKPDEDRSAANSVVTVTSRLPGVKPVPAQLFFGKKDGRAVAVTQNLSQPSIFDDPERSNITPLTLVVDGQKGRETA